MRKHCNARCAADRHGRLRPLLRATRPKLLLGNVLAVALCGCTGMPPLLAPRDEARTHLEYLSQAIAASASMREMMWRDVASAPPEEAQLRKALLQSIPGTSRYNPKSAETELGDLLAQRPSAGIAAVARVRLESLRSLTECREQTEILKERLSKIADIERGTALPRNP